MVVDEARFARLVREAYAHLYDRVFLRAHPLTALIVGGDGAAAERLHRVLLDAIDQARPMRSAGVGGVEWRRYRHLEARYREGATSEQIARELGVSGRQARRDHTEALDQIAQQLWTRVVYLPTKSIVRDAARQIAPPDRPASGTDLDIELAKLATARSGATDLPETLRGVVGTAAQFAAAHRVTVELDVASSLPPVRADRTVLRQVLLTLLSDTIARQPGGGVRITASTRGGSVDVQLSADGGEVDPKRMAPSPRSAGDAEGVLALARKLSRGQGMEVEAVPRERGEQSINVRMLPAAVKTLLLVDDNPDVALLFRRFLGEGTYRVVQARSASRALRLAAELRPDVVFLDLLMPLADGWEILQALRASPVTADLRVVICSVLPDLALARSFGVSEMLPKPVTRADLLAVLADQSAGIAGRRALHESIVSVRPLSSPQAG